MKRAGALGWQLKGRRAGCLPFTQSPSPHIPQLLTLEGAVRQHPTGQHDCRTSPLRSIPFPSHYSPSRGLCVSNQWAIRVLPLAGRPERTSTAVSVANEPCAAVSVPCMGYWAARRR